mmetsp:Transcript_144771/g.463965  ORF Transcript_144771/g.463965 Transcript_144771/m.463965 type:complete len:318 (+) Transcript_144771:980-1933(+)
MPDEKAPRNPDGSGLSTAPCVAWGSRQGRDEAMVEQVEEIRPMVVMQARGHVLPMASGHRQGLRSDQEGLGQQQQLHAVGLQPVAHGLEADRHAAPAEAPGARRRIHQAMEVQRQPGQQRPRQQPEGVEEVVRLHGPELQRAGLGEQHPLPRVGPARGAHVCVERDSVTCIDQPSHVEDGHVRLLRAAAAAAAAAVAVASPTSPERQKGRDQECRGRGCENRPEGRAEGLGRGDAVAQARGRHEARVCHEDEVGNRSIHRHLPKHACRVDAVIIRQGERAGPQRRHDNFGQALRRQSPAPGLQRRQLRLEVFDDDGH